MVIYSGLISNLLSRSARFHFVRKVVAQIPFDEGMDAIDHRGEEDGHGKLVHIIDHPDGKDPDQVPVRSYVESNEQDDKAVYKLGNKG